MARYKKKVKDLVKYKLSVPEYISLYKANTAKWAYEQTKVFYDEQTKTLHKPHYFQIVLMNGTYSSKLTVVLKCRQCKYFGDFIDTPDGSFNIKKLYDKFHKNNENIILYSLDNKNNVVFDVLEDIWSVGKKDVYEVKLFSGEKFICTKEHRINTPSGYKKLSDLKKNDEIIVPKLEFHNENLMSNDEVKLLAYLLTDGSTINQIKFTNTNLKYLKDFENCIKNIFPELKIRKVKKGNGWDYLPNVGYSTNKKNKLHYWCEKFNIIKKKTIDKHIPKQIFKLNKEQTALFLNRLFACDGWVCLRKRNNNLNHCEVGIGSPNEKFIHDVRLLCNKFGIHGHVYKEQFGGKDFWKFRITHRTSLDIFQKEINIYGKEFELDYKHKSHKNLNRIKYIKYIGKEECYDLTTKYYHNYISNGISTHNSGFSTAITAMCAHDVLFNLTKGILFVSISKVHSEELMDKFYKAIDSIIDPRFRLTYVRKTLTECEFTNGIKVRSLSSNPDTMIGFTGTVVWDEAGRFDIQTSREVWTCLFPSITTPGNRMYVISTPFGKHNIFHNLCTSSNEIFSSVEKSNISRKFIKVHWRDVPHVAQQINILRENCVTENAFKMGYCCEFGEETVDSLFPYEFMRDYAYPKDHKIIPFDIRNILKTDPMGNFLNNESVMYL